MKEINSITEDIVEFVSHQADRALNQLAKQFIFGINQKEGTPQFVKLVNWSKSGKSFFEAIQSIYDDGVGKWSKDTFWKGIDKTHLKLQVNASLRTAQLDKELQTYGEAMADSLADVLSAKTPFDKSVAVTNFTNSYFNLISKATGMNESNKKDGQIVSEEQVQSINRQVTQVLQPIYDTDEYFENLHSDLEGKFLHVNEVTDKSTSVSGAAEAGSIITVVQSGMMLGTATANDEGQYIVTIPIQTAGTVLEVTAEDESRNVSPVTQVTVKAETVYQQLKKKINVDPHYDFTVKFNQDLDVSTIAESNIYVKNNSSIVEGVKVSLNPDKRSVKLEAPNEGYELGESYTIYVEKAIKSEQGKELKQPMKMQFIIKE